MAKFFGTNGIRGVFPEDFNLEFIHDMTLSIGTYLVRLYGKELNHYTKIIKI